MKLWSIYLHSLELCSSSEHNSSYIDHHDSSSGLRVIYHGEYINKNPPIELSGSGG